MYLDATMRIIYIIILTFILAVCNCCDVKHYDVVCEKEQMSISVLFGHPFTGTFYANGYSGNPNCSSPNMETTESREVTLNISFMQCNMIIRKIEGRNQAMNTFTIQFNPLIRSALDCQIYATCNLDYPLPPDFFQSYFSRDLKTPTPVTSKLDIMSGEKLFGEVMADLLGVSQRQYLVLNVTDGGQHDQLRIRKCYAHARNVVDQITTPDLLLEDNQCFRERSVVDWLTLNADKSYSDLRDFSEIQNLEISFNQRSFYITCAFDMCSGYCSYSCLGEMEIKKSRWSTVRTHQVGLFDKSFKGFRNRNIDFKSLFKVLTDGFMKLKDRQSAHKSIMDSEERTQRLDSTEQETDTKVSPDFKEKTLTRLDSIDSFVQLRDKTSTDNHIVNASDDASTVSANQGATKYSFEHVIDDVSLNVSEMKAPERFEKRSVIKDEAKNFDKSSYALLILHQIPISVVDSPGLSTAATLGKSNIISDTDCFNSSCRPDKNVDILEKSKKHMNGTDCINSCGLEEHSAMPDKFKKRNITGCFNSSCIPDEDASSTLASENSVTKNLSREDDTLEFDEINSILDFNFTDLNDEFFATKNSTEKNCVPYFRYASVTSSLSLLCVSLILILVFIFVTRNERKRYFNRYITMFNNF